MELLLKQKYLLLFVMFVSTSACLSHKPPVSSASSISSLMLPVLVKPVPPTPPPTPVSGSPKRLRGAVNAVRVGLRPTSPDVFIDKKTVLELVKKYKDMIELIEGWPAESMLEQFIFWRTELNIALENAILLKAFKGVCKTLAQKGSECNKAAVAKYLKEHAMSRLTPTLAFELDQAILGVGYTQSCDLTVWMDTATPRGEIIENYRQEIARLRSTTATPKHS